MLLFFFNLVLGIYKTLVKVTADDEFNSVRDRLSSEKINKAIKKNNDIEENNAFNIKNLQEAKNKIQELEDKLKQLEAKLDHRTPKKYPTVKFLNYKNRKRVLITGGAGFVGSHLVDRMMLAGHEIIVVDNFLTGRKRNVEHWIGHENFELVHHDVVRPLYVEVDEIYHLASPASPPHYMLNPVKTIKTNTLGTINMLGEKI